MRRHWLVVFHRPAWLWFMLGALGIGRLLGSGQMSRVWLTIRPFLPQGMRLSMLTHDLFLASVLLWGLGAAGLLGALGLWYATVIIIDDAAITVRTPFSSNVIPLQAIQDIQTAHPLLGFLFNYGTLVLYSGNETECIDHVPNVADVVRELYPRRR